MFVKRISAVLLTVAMAFSVFAIVPSAATRNAGDVNGDGRINVGDYTLVKRHVLGSYTLNEDQKVGADANGDGRINVGDYTLIKRHVLGTYVIGSGPVEKSAVEKIKDKLGKNNILTIHYSGSIAQFDGEADISFELIGGVLHLRGKAVTEEGLEIDMLIPMAKVAKTYSFSGDAKMKVGNKIITGETTGSLNAAEYSVDDVTFKDIQLSSSMDLDATQEKRLKELCKAAMDQFLHQANKLLENEKIGVTISDLGFTNFYQEIQDGMMDL